MKPGFNLILGTVLLSSISFTAKADDSVCFMIDADGNLMNLGSLCQNRTSKSNRSQVFEDNYYQAPAEINGRSAPTKYQLEKGFYSVPIKSRRGGIPVIDVKFNNRHVFEMMLDTGASEIVITEQMAKILKVNHTQDVWVSTPSDNYVKMPSGYLYSVGVSDISLDNPLVITSPNMDMGLLGQSFFSRYDLTIKSDVIEFRER